MDQHFCTNSELNVIYAIGTGSKHTQRMFRELLDDDFFDNECKRRFQKFHKAFESGQLPEFREQHKALLKTPDIVIHIWDAVKTVRNHAIRRKVEKAVYEVAEKCRDYSEDLSDVQDQLKSSILEAMDPRACKAPSCTKDDILKLADGMQNETVAFYTGHPSVDKIAPIQPGDYVILGARPAVGKSALASGMLRCNFLNKDKKRGIFFCIEMDTRQSYARLSSQMSRVPLSKYINSRNNPPTVSELKRVMENFEHIKNEFPDRWFVEGAITLEEICKITEMYKPDFIMIDYIQIVRCKHGRNTTERLEHISMELRDLALTQKIAVIALAQLNRDADGSIPKMANLKGSSQLDQDATHIFLLDRPESELLKKVEKREYCNNRGDVVEVYKPGSLTNKAALLCNKNRNGPNFYSLLDFNPATTEFTEYLD